MRPPTETVRGKRLDARLYYRVARTAAAFHYYA
jgi:hypothetical protein